MRTVILGDSNSNFMYVGETNLSDSDLRTYIQDGTPIHIKEARVFHHQIVMMMTPQGPNTMASTKVYPFPLTNSGGEMLIRATVYIDVDSSPEFAKNLRSLMSDCHDLEQKLRAQQSGLMLAREIPRS